VAPARILCRVRHGDPYEQPHGPEHRAPHTRVHPRWSSWLDSTSRRGSRAIRRRARYESPRRRVLRGASMNGHRALGILLLLLAYGCGGRPQVHPVQETSGFLDDYSFLREGAPGDVALVYRNPNADWSRYDAVLLEPVTLWRSGRNSLDPVPEDDLLRLVSAFQNALRQQLGAGFRLADHPGPGGMPIRLPITAPPPPAPSSAQDSGSPISPVPESCASGSRSPTPAPRIRSSTCCAREALVCPHRRAVRSIPSCIASSKLPPSRARFVMPRRANCSLRASSGAGARARLHSTPGPRSRALSTTRRPGCARRLPGAPSERGSGDRL